MSGCQIHFLRFTLLVGLNAVLIGIDVQYTASDLLVGTRHGSFFQFNFARPLETCHFKIRFNLNITNETVKCNAMVCNRMFDDCQWFHGDVRRHVGRLYADFQSGWRV